MSKTKYEQDLDAKLNEWNTDELSEYLNKNCEETELNSLSKGIEIIQDWLTTYYEFNSDIHLKNTILNLNQRDIQNILQLIFNDLELPNKTFEAIEAAMIFKLPTFSSEKHFNILQQQLKLRILTKFKILSFLSITDNFEYKNIRSPENCADTHANIAFEYIKNNFNNKKEIFEIAIYHYRRSLDTYLDIYINLKPTSKRIVLLPKCFGEHLNIFEENPASFSEKNNEYLQEILEYCRQIIEYEKEYQQKNQKNWKLRGELRELRIHNFSMEGDIYFSEKKWRRAIWSYKSAIKEIESFTNMSIFDEENKQKIITENIKIYHNIVISYLALKKYKKAITYTERSRSRRLVSLIASNEFYSNAGIPPEIQDYLTRYEALEKQLHNLRNKDDLQDSDKKWFRHFQKYKFNSAVQGTELKQTIQALETRKQTLWQEIRRADPVIAQQIQVETIFFEEIAALLPNPESAILSIYNTGAETHILIIRYPATTLTKSGPFSLFQQLNRAQPVVTLHSCPELTYQQLEKLLTEQWLVPYQENQSRWRASLNQNLKNIAQALNLEQLIAEHLVGIKELIIIPHLGLHHIPFAALPIGAPQKIDSLLTASRDELRIKLKAQTKVLTVQPNIRQNYLGDQFQIRILPSCQILKYCHDRPQLQQKTYGLVENATEDLQFTHIEANRLKQLETVFPENHLRGRTEATVDNYQDLLARVENVHSSHHAKSDLSNPRESALELSDGQFSLGSLMLKRYPNLNHVFLSCCETNLGQPNLTDDLLTLGTGFLCAGARTVISSLWAVDDLATAIFTSYYYEALKKTQKPSLALQTAQQRLRKATYTNLLAEFPTAQEALTLRQKQNPSSLYPFIDPYYWSAFICQGV